MWPTEEELESLDKIIDRMNPQRGFPYPMRAAKNDPMFPRSVGDPWHGAYTSNGYWYRIGWASTAMDGGEVEEWRQIVGEMSYRNGFLLDTDTLRLAQNVAVSSADVRFLVAKNIRGEVLGGLLMTTNSSTCFTVIGAHFVVEDFRHVGIGAKLLTEAFAQLPDSQVAINLVSFLHDSAIAKRVGLNAAAFRRITQIVVDKPSGFADLSEIAPHGVCLKFGRECDAENWQKIDEFGVAVMSEHRNWQAFLNVATTEICAAFDETSKNCVGICVLRENLNDDDEYGTDGIPDLLIAPLYANNDDIAAVLLRKSLLKFYNPDDDYDFDVDDFAIYRRSVNFFVLDENQEKMMSILKTLAGATGSIKKCRLTYQTFSTSALPAISHVNIFAISDLNLFII